MHSFLKKEDIFLTFIFEKVVPFLGWLGPSNKIYTQCSVNISLSNGANKQILFLFFRFSIFWMNSKLDWLVHSILGALLEASYIIWRKNVLTPFLDFAWCVMLSLFRFYRFWMECVLEWLVHIILGALLEAFFIIWSKKRFNPFFGLSYYFSEFFWACATPSRLMPLLLGRRCPF